MARSTLGLKTVGDIRDRADALAVRLGAVVIAVAAVFALWTQIEHGKGVTWLTFGIAALALIAAVAAAARRREGWAFLGTGVAIAAVIASLFIALYPNVMPSTDDEWTLTIFNAASGHYTLTVMTWVAVLATPFVLLYQGWTFWVFRRRIGTHHIPMPESADDPTPIPVG